MHCPSCKTQVLDKSTSKPLEIKDKYCSGCGITINQKEEFFYCSNCKNHYNCRTCRLCINQHFLNKLVYLSHIKSIYAGNTYTCNVCQVSKQTNDNGIWGCISCSYFLCPDCCEQIYE